MSFPAKNIPFFVSLILLVSGLLISIYLLYHYIQIGNTANNIAKADVCSTVFGKGCDTALQSNLSSQFGLPLAAWGVIYYFGILLLLFVPLLFGRSFKSASDFFIYLVTFVGALTALTLLTVMLVNTSLFCPLCSIIHCINIALFFFLNRATQFSLRKRITVIKEGGHSLFNYKMRSPELWWKLFGFASILFLVISMYFGLQILTYRSDDQQSALIDSKPILAEYRSQKVQLIPLEPDDPVNGITDSPIRLVVFSDFFCPSCRRFSKELHNIIQKGQGKYTVIFKHFPLSTSCNFSIDKNMHPSACEAAYAAVAANQQGKFWAFHDTIFSTDNTEPGNYTVFFNTVAQKTGLDIALFDTYRNSEMAKAKVSRDIVLAAKLGIDATPSVYLNGKLVKDMRPGILQFLITRELERITVNSDTTRNKK